MTDDGVGDRDNRGTAGVGIIVWMEEVGMRMIRTGWGGLWKGGDDDGGGMGDYHRVGNRARDDGGRGVDRGGDDTGWLWVDLGVTGT
jgi:hypothetical protein